MKKELKTILDGLNAADLIEASGYAKEKAAEKRATARGPIIAEFERLAKAAGFKDLKEAGIRVKGMQKKAAQYANPANKNETWSGRGRKPDWLQKQIDLGKSLEDFEVGGPKAA